MAMVNDDPRTGKSPTLMNVKIRDLMRSDRRLTIREIIDEFNSNFMRLGQF